MTVSLDKVKDTAAALSEAFNQLITGNPYIGALSALVQSVFLWHLGLVTSSPAELVEWGGPFSKPMWGQDCPVAISSLYDKLRDINPCEEELGMALEEFYLRRKTGFERNQGVYYTKPLLAKTMARLAINLYLKERMRSSSSRLKQENARLIPASFKLLDPAVGAGAFLVAALEELVSLPSDFRPGETISELLPFLAGHDIDQGAIYLTKARLWLKAAEEIKHKDRSFPDLPGISVGNSLEGLLPPADVVLANPPYCRQESLSKELKTFLSKRFQGVIPRQADLYAYFLADLPYMLKQGGVAVVVTPTAWLEVDYGRAAQKLLVQNLEIPLVIASACERWFDDVAVHTAITAFVRRSDRRKPRRPITMVNLLATLEAVNFEEIAALAEGSLGFKKQDVDWQAVTWPQKRFQALTHKKESVRASWGTLLRAPSVYFSLHEKTAGKWIAAGEVGEIRRGFTTGANAFFYVQDITAGASPDLLERYSITPDNGMALIATRAGRKEAYFAVEKRFLRPLIKSPREIAGYFVQEDSLRQRVLVLPPDENSLSGLKVTDYIRWGESHGYHERPTLKARPLWWSLPDLLPAQVLARQFYDKRFNFPYNPETLLCDHTFYYLTNLGDPELIAAVLNSTITFFHVELWGRSNMGDGVLTFYGPELSDLPLVKPVLFSLGQQQDLKTAFRELSRRAVSPIQQELQHRDRQKLDLIVLAALGLTGLEARSCLGEIYNTLGQLVDQRLKRSR